MSFLRAARIWAPDQNLSEAHAFVTYSNQEWDRTARMEKFREAEHVFDKYESIVNDDRKSFQIREYKKE